MPGRRRHLPYVWAIAAGMLLWFSASLVTGKREPWDGPEYWGGAYPAAILVVGVLAWFFPERPWRWALSLFLAQFAAMTIRSGELGNLWPLGMLFFVVLSLPAMALALVVAGQRLRRRPPADDEETQG